MAKKKARRAPVATGMTCTTTACGPKCLIMMLIGIALAALGLILIVGGVLKQMDFLPWTKAFMWYAGGFILWCLAKKCKLAACPTCR